MVRLESSEKKYIQSSSPWECGNPDGFPKSVGRVESRHHGFPCFPNSAISMACFLPGDLDARATPPNPMRRTRHERLS
jgi:hypothetical protein